MRQQSSKTDHENKMKAIADRQKKMEQKMQAHFHRLYAEQFRKLNEEEGQAHEMWSKVRMWFNEAFTKIEERNRASVESWNRGIGKKHRRCGS